VECQFVAIDINVENGKRGGEIYSSCFRCRAFWWDYAAGFIIACYAGVAAICVDAYPLQTLCLNFYGMASAVAVDGYFVLCGGGAVCEYVVIARRCCQQYGKDNDPVWFYHCLSVSLYACFVV
jgi:hypothetical protein